MGRNYRFLHAAVMLLALGVLTAASVPARATALDNTTRDSSASAFCTSLSNRANAAQKRFNKLQTKVKSAWESQDTR